MYLPADRVTPQKMADLSSPGVFAPLQGGPPVVIGKDAEGGSVGVLLNADQGYPRVDLKSYRLGGVLVHPVEYEVDHESAYDLSVKYTAPGSVARVGERLELIASAHTGTFPDEARIILAEGLPVASDSPATGFLKWRACVRDGDEKRTLAEVSVEIPERSAF